VPSKPGPSVRQRRVARTLRQWRTDRGLKLDDVVRQFGWSESKLSRFERAEVNAGPSDIIALATILGVDEATRDKTVRLAVAARGQDQWGPYSAESLRGDFRGFVEDEAEATEVCNVETTLITGLLQTGAYADAILRSAIDFGDDVIDERRRLRQQRQARLTRTDEPLHLHAIVYEHALRLPIGDAGVMRAQLDHLIASADMPNVTIQVIPAEVGAYSGIGTSYHLVSFESAAPSAVYLENLVAGFYIEDEEDVAAYKLNFGRLRDLALDPASSVGFIADIRGS